MDKSEAAINQLKAEIELQRKRNIEIYESIPVANREDPLNKKAEPILKIWREGSTKLKNMISELEELELASKSSTSSNSNIFVNGFGEATKRNITCSSYENAKSRTKKAVLSFIN